MFEIEKKVSKGDYLYSLVPTHPNASKHGYVLMHRVVMENYLGRLLLPQEVVHHIDGNKKNNSIENLQLLTREEHSRMHQLERGAGRYTFVCPCCGKIFERQRRSYGKTKYGPFCSRHCNGKFVTTLKSQTAVS